MVSKLSQMQARFQQKQMQEKEEKLLRLYENQQQRTIERVNRGSAGSNTSVSSVTSVTSTQGGKVRQMFDERRQKAGIDRSYPLDPIRNVNNKTVVSKTTVHVRNGKPVLNKREVAHTNYSNNNGNEYYEERRYEDDNVNSPSNYGRIINKTYRPRDLEALMKNHNIQDNLDDEEFPDFGIDDIDESAADQHLARKSPYQNGTVKLSKNQKHTLVNGNASPVKDNVATKKEIKTNPRKTTVHAAFPKQTSSSPTLSNSNKVASPLTSPAKSPEKSSPTKMASTPRTPSASRSAKSTPSAVPSTVARDDLTACRYCSRRFATDRITKHEEVCARTAKKKRKAYDATKHRVQGTELEPYIRKGVKPSASKQTKGASPVRKSDWRRKHEEFISAIRAAKMAQDHVAKGGKLSDLPPPPPSYNPDYVQCPHCGRKFNETAAARHIPKCASYDFNKPKAQTRPAGTNKNSFK